MHVFDVNVKTMKEGRLGYGSFFCFEFGCYVTVANINKRRRVRYHGYYNIYLKNNQGFKSFREKKNA